VGEFTVGEPATPTPLPAEPAERDAAAGAESAVTEEPGSPVYQPGPMSAEETPVPDVRDTFADPSQRLAESVEVAEPVQALATERPIWPMVLFSGVALMVAAVVLRWIFQPRSA
jgi:hypothetical protein